MADPTTLQGIDWGVAGNWTNGVPVSNDHAFISPTLDGNVTAGMDQGAVDLDLLHIPLSEFPTSIGVSGSPLRIAADAVEHYGRGNLYYLADANAGGGLDTDFVRIQCAHSRVITELTSGAGNDAGDYHEIVLERGIVKMLAAIAFDAAAIVAIGYVSNPASDVNLSIAAGADTLPELRQGGGVVDSSGAITTAYVHRGDLTQDTAAITTLHIGNGATVNYNHTALTLAIVYPGGRLNLLGNVLAKTVTTCYAMPGSIVDYNTDLVDIQTFYDYRRPKP